MRRRLLPRVAFMLVLVYFAVGWKLRPYPGEFYPSLTYPDFSGHGTISNSAVELGDTVIQFKFMDGSAIELLPSELFDQFPVERRSWLLGYFRPLDEKETLLNQRPVRTGLYRWFPYLRRADFERATIDQEKRLHTWLVSRAERLAPGKSLNEVVFRFQKWGYVLGSQGLEQRKLLEQRETKFTFGEHP